MQLYGLTWPLLTKSDGAKMGKTEAGAIWLSAERTSPYQFYQYWINVEDADAGKCLRFLTDLPQKRSKRSTPPAPPTPAPREPAPRWPRRSRGWSTATRGFAAARRATEIFFGAEIDRLSDAQLGEIFADVPSKRSRARLDGAGLNVVDAFVEAGLAKSKGEARRTIEQGGGNVNNRRIEAIDRQLTVEDLASETVMVLRSGERNTPCCGSCRRGDEPLVPGLRLGTHCPTGSAWAAQNLTLA